MAGAFQTCAYISTFTSHTHTSTQEYVHTPQTHTHMKCVLGVSLEVRRTLILSREDLTDALWTRVLPSVKTLFTVSYVRATVSEKSKFRKLWDFHFLPMINSWPPQELNCAKMKAAASSLFHVLLTRKHLCSRKPPAWVTGLFKAGIASSALPQFNQAFSLRGERRTVVTEKIIWKINRKSLILHIGIMGKKKKNRLPNHWS